MPFDCEIRKRICKTVLLDSGVLFAFVNYIYVHVQGRYSKDSLTFRACLHEGGGPQVGVVTCGGLSHGTCKRDPIKMRDYMDRRITVPQLTRLPHPSGVPYLHVNRPLLIISFTLLFLRAVKCFLYADFTPALLVQL